MPYSSLYERKLRRLRRLQSPVLGEGLFSKLASSIDADEVKTTGSSSSPSEATPPEVQSVEETKETDSGKSAKIKEADSGKFARTKETDSGKFAGTKETASGRFTKTKEADSGRFTRTNEADSGRFTRTKEADSGKFARAKETVSGKFARAKETDSGKLARTKDTDSGKSVSLDEKIVSPTKSTILDEDAEAKAGRLPSEDKTNIYKEAILVEDNRGNPYIVVVEVPPEEELIKKSWLLNPDKPPKKPNELYIERVPFEAEDMESLYRSRSLDFSDTLKEKYLSRWSRENTPIDSQDQYERTVRRSYTPVREVGDYRYVDDDRKPVSIRRIRTPLDAVTVPYHTNYRYYQEQQPFRKYDIFQIRTWAYPIYKYLHGRDHQSTRPYSYTRVYGNASLYTPPKLSAEPTPMTSPRGYSGYVYMAGEHSFDVSSRPRSLDNYQFWRSHVTRSPWYWTYYGNSGLRHYNSFRPRAYTSRLSTYWSPYY